MTEQYAEDLYGTPPEGDGPQGEELVTDPGDSPSYAVLSPTPPTDARQEFGQLLEAGVFANLPKNPTDHDIVEALGVAASILWGAGYRKVAM
jgi:hypothetical protein